MSSERKLVAVQLANQQLTESMEKIAAEIAELREQNEHLTEENTRLQARLETIETQYKTLQDEYKKGTGLAYSGTMQTSKYGFGKSD